VKATLSNIFLTKFFGDFGTQKGKELSLNHSNFEKDCSSVSGLMLELLQSHLSYLFSQKEKNLNVTSLQQNG